MAIQSWPRKTKMVNGALLGVNNGISQGILLQTLNFFPIVASLAKAGKYTACVELITIKVKLFISSQYKFILSQYQFMLAHC